MGVKYKMHLKFSKETCSLGIHVIYITLSVIFLNQAIRESANKHIVSIMEVHIVSIMEVHKWPPLVDIIFI